MWLYRSRFLGESSREQTALKSKLKKKVATETFPQKYLALSSYFSNTVHHWSQGLCATYMPHNFI